MFLQLCVVLFLINIIVKACGSECTCVSGYLRDEKSKLSTPEAFRFYNITPYHLPVPPVDQLKAEFITANVELGSFIPPPRIIDPAFIRYPQAKEGEKYTLILLDFDGFQSKDMKGYTLYALVVNVPKVDNIFLAGDMVAPFFPHAPSLGSGIHRLGALLYEQNGRIEPNNPDMMN
ncbi:unnamed protein product [Pieris macdunnoughi]|uniref:Uncharacterized protein n=1 Tax=Pieris macdunnoughi TaxID=345717 RepID=A0A821U7L2_9NEOP|nr:unnamed protein product [Pieris macdunnoughi]